MKKVRVTRFTTLLLITLMTCAIFTACSSEKKGSGNSSEENENVTGKSETSAGGEAASTGKEDPKDIEGDIRYFTWTEEQVDGIRKSIEAFNKEYPNINVDLQTAPWDQYWSKMQTEIAGGTCADVFMNQTWYFKTLQESGAAEPLTPLIERDAYAMEGHNQKVIDIYTENDVLYAMPQDWDCECIVFNKDLFDKYGVDYPDDTLKWNPADGGSFLELAQKMTIDKNGKNVTEEGFDPDNIVSYGFLVQNSNNACYWNFIAMNGGDVNKYDDEKTEEAMQFLQDLMFKYKVAPQMASVQSMGADAMFASGNVAMYTTGNWVLSTLGKTCDFDWQTSVLPEGPKGRATLVNGIGQSVYSGSKNKEAAWEFVKWLGSDKNQEIMGNTGVVFPSKNTYWDNYINYWSEQGVDASPFREMFDIADIYTAPMVPYWNEKNAAITKNIDLLFMNKINAKEMGDAIAAEYAKFDE